MIKLTIHTAIFLIYSFGTYYDYFCNRGPPEIEEHYNSFGGKLKFLTCIDLIMQWAFFGFCIFCDQVGTTTQSNKEKHVLQRFRDWAFTTLILPMGIYVSLMFWGVYAIDRNLIFPVFMDSWFPSWLNHIMHTLPVAGCMIEILMECHIYQKGVARYIPMFIAYLLYLFWTLYIKYAGGIWVYPLYEALGETERNIFFAFLTVPSLSSVFLGEKIHTAVWGKANDQLKTARKEE